MTDRDRHSTAEYGGDPDGPRPLPYSAYPKAADVAGTGYSPCPNPCRSWISRGPSPTAAAGTPRSSRRT